MIYLFFSLIFDGFCSRLINNSYQNISVFFPMIFICSIPICFNLIKNKKLLLIILVVIGIIYDTLYSDVFFVNIYFFVLYFLFLYGFYLKRKTTFLNILITSILGVVFYDAFVFFLLLFLDYSNLKMTYLLYKIVHSLLFNVIYILLSLLIFKSRIFSIKKKKYNY